MQESRVKTITEDLATGLSLKHLLGGALSDRWDDIIGDIIDDIIDVYNFSLRSLRTTEKSERKRNGTDTKAAYR